MRAFFTQIICKIKTLKKNLFLLSTLIIILTITFLSNASAQKVIASLDFERRDPRPLWFEYSKHDEGLVTISYSEKKSSRNVCILKYDNSFKLQWSKTLFENSNKIKIEYLAVLGNRILTFLSIENSKENQVDLLLYEYTLEGKQIHIGKRIHSFDRKSNEDDLMTYVRSMSKRNLLLLEKPDKKSKDQIQLKAFVFRDQTSEVDTDQKPIQINLPAPSSEIVFKNIHITNTGDIIILFRLNSNDRIKQKEDIHYQVNRYSQPNYSPISVEVKYPDVFITDLIVKPDREGNLLLGGFFSNKNSSQVAGLLFGKIDGSINEITTLTKQNFSEDFLAKYLTPRQIERKRELADFYLDNLVLRSDGGMLFITEQYFFSTSAYRDIYGFWYNKDLYNYDDVVVFSVSADGEIEWNSVITKNQSGENPSELSYIGLIGSEYLYILYKTKIKNSGTNVYVSRIEYDGKTDQPVPFNEFHHGNDIFYRSFSEQISNDMAILVFYSGKAKIFSLKKVIF